MSCFKAWRHVKLSSGKPKQITITYFQEIVSHADFFVNYGQAFVQPPTTRKGITQLETIPNGPKTEVKVA